MDAARREAARAAGLLLHPTSLPGSHGIGDLGPEADAFLDWAAAAGQRLWQILPLGPTGPHHSPYAALSAFAGNPSLLSPELLAREGLLAEGELDARPSFPTGRVDFERMIPWKRAVLRLAWTRFETGARAEHHDAFDAFVRGPSRPFWLADWALFSALKGRFGGRSWLDWPDELRRRDPSALRTARAHLAGEIAYHAFLQFLFRRQWERVRAEARSRGIRILGDVPIYVALDSADVWTNPRLFDLDDRGLPLEVSGVPPDAFSATGQLWGSPLYRWDRLAQEDYGWWIARLRENLDLADLLRIDHFRGFASYWAVPATAPTAESGVWRPGPGLAFFEALRSSLGDLPLIAEDLGSITPDVRDLLLALDLPGTKVLQFAFGMPDSDHLPERFGPRNAVYTGTHDNDTARSWFDGLGGEERRRALQYLGTDGSEIHWDLIGAAYRSVAELAVVPLQDVFGIASEGRMNDPRRPDGNWSWRVTKELFVPETAARLRSLADQSGRR